MATALITGGTSGIGAAFAGELAARGYDLVLVARGADDLASAAAALTAAHGIAVETIRADLAVRNEVARVIERIEDASRPIDLLINNAGSGVYATLTSADTTAHEHGFAVMCLAVLLLGGAAGRSMRARGSGAILNVSSVQSLFTTGSYSAMKSWVTAYSQSLSVELARSGVTVTALLPGWVSTPWHQRAGVRRSTIPGWLWLEPRAVALTALRDVGRGRAISIPTLRYRVISGFARHLPRAAVRWISGKISSQRTDAPPASDAPFSTPTTAEDHR